MMIGRARALVVAGVLGAAAIAQAQPGPDAGMPDAGMPDAGNGPAAGDGGMAGDAGPPRIVIDGPVLLGIGKPQASASASPSELRLGEKLTLFVEVVYDDNVTIALPAGLDLAPALDELKRSSVEERRSDGTRKRTYQIQLQVWELGEFDLPPVQVTYSIGGQSSWIVTNAIPLRVLGTIDTIDDPNALLGATPPVPIKRRDWRWIAFAVAVGVLLLIGLVTWLASRRRKARAAARRVEERAEPGELPAVDIEPTTAAAATVVNRPAPPPPRRLVVTMAMRARLGDAARRALDALDALDKAGTLTTDQLAGYREMVAIVRTFLLDQFALPSRHRTSRELVAALGKTAIIADGLAAAERWLAAADLVKFAGAVDDDDGAAALAAARALIVQIAGRGEGGGP